MNKRKAFTLLEMLITVTILSGLVIMAMAVFGRVARSSETVNRLKLNSQASRLVMDSISNDFRYVYNDATFTSLKKSGADVSDLDGDAFKIVNNSIKGFGYFSGTIADPTPTLGMILYYPQSRLFAYKEYLFVEKDGRKSVYIREATNCSGLDGGAFTCSSVTAKQDLLPATVALDKNSLKVTPTDNKTLSLGITIKPEEYKSSDCVTALPDGICFSAQTTLNVGVKK